MGRQRQGECPKQCPVKLVRVGNRPHAEDLGQGKQLGVVLVVQLVSRHSCVADRLPVVDRFPAGPRVKLKTVDPPKGNGG